MLASSLFALAGVLSAAFAQTKVCLLYYAVNGGRWALTHRSQGFNYGATNTDNSAVTESQYQDRFTTAQNLVGASGFTSARLYTLIQAGTTNTPTEAIQAAINTKTTLLLGLWGSGGQSGIDNELAALSSALGLYGSAFTDLIVGISVGSEDLYRISPTGIENMSGVGAGPDVITSYISQVRSAITNTGASSKPVGHVDTWTAWVNSSNDAVISASDFIGVDAYPYFQNTMANAITDGYSLFFDAYDATVSVAGGKPVWVTETGWPVSGATENLAVPSLQNAQTYWDAVGCGRLFGQVNTWWYTLQDAYPTTPNPSFGIVGSTLSDTPLYDLSCSGVSSSTSSGATAGATAAIASADATAAQAGGIGASQKIGSGSEATGEASSAGATVAPTETSAAAGGAAPAQTAAVSASAAPAGSVTASAAQPEGTVFSTEAITITSCSGGCPEKTQTQPTSSATTVPTTLITKTSVLSAASEAVATASGCPASLSGTYEYPHLIVPVDKENPDTAGGTSYNGTISSTVSSIFNFDIPSSDSGKTCTLVFLFPTQNELTTSAFGLGGSGGLDVAELSGPATEETSYNTVPSVAKDLGGPSSVTPGNEYVIASGSCTAGTRIGYEVSATGSLSLNYFQDFNPSPIGFYITVC